MLIVLVGLAGSGKTELLHRLAAAGEHTIDLEALAGHRGSAFGAGMSAQPAHADFQADVRARLSEPAPRTWIEDEGDYVGAVGLPPELIAAMHAAPGVEVVATRPERIARLADGYAALPLPAWLTAIKTIRPRAGSAAADAAAKAVRAGDLPAAVAALLDYYDHGYTHRTRAFVRPVICRVRVDVPMAELLAVIFSRSRRGSPGNGSERQLERDRAQRLFGQPHEANEASPAIE